MAYSIPTDREIGQIWQDCTKGVWKDTFCGERCIRLILKLIEERAARYMINGSMQEEYDSPESKVCSEFGIPEEEYLEAKGEVRDS